MVFLVGCFESFRDLRVAFRAEENVKVRLHRGHGMVRSWLLARVGANAKDAFPFMGVRCDRVVQNVFARLAGSWSGPEIQ